MKTILSILILIYSLNQTYAQIRLGYSKELFLFEYADMSPKLYDTLGCKGIELAIREGIFTYFLNDSNIIYMCTFTPYTEESLKDFKEVYNTDLKFQKVEKDVWRTEYQPTIRIIFVNDEKNKTKYFLYEFEKNLNP